MPQLSRDRDWHPGMPAALRPAIGRRVDAWLWIPPEAHESGVLRVTDFEEGEEVKVVPRESMEVLEEELQLVFRQRLVMSLVAHGPTIRTVVP